MSQAEYARRLIECLDPLVREVRQMPNVVTPGPTNIVTDEQLKKLKSLDTKVAAYAELLGLRALPSVEEAGIVAMGTWGRAWGVWGRPWLLWLHQAEVLRVKAEALL